MTKGKLQIMGQIEVVEDGENYKTNLGLLIVFENTDEIRQALKDGKCEFEFEFQD